jgi:hypothetical protein
VRPGIIGNRFMCRQGVSADVSRARRQALDDARVRRETGFVLFPLMRGWPGLERQTGAHPPSSFRIVPAGTMTHATANGNGDSLNGAQPSTSEREAFGSDDWELFEKFLDIAPES